jgi:DNA-binding transcriptional LysR family regulator
MFAAVADAGSFTAASDRLHVVQSAVSAGIRSLERELGASLFDRTTRQVQLSDAGRALLPEARRMLADEALALDSVRLVREGVRGSVAVGTMQAPLRGAARPARLLAMFHAAHPEVEIVVRHVGGSLAMADRVREGTLDLAFLSLANERPPGLQLTRLASEAMMLATGPDHPLGARASVELGELQEEPFADLPEGWGLRMVSDRSFAAARAEREIVFELNDTTSLVDFVREGLAVALLPPSIAQLAPEIALVPIRRHAPSFTTYLAEASEARHTAAVRALLDLIRGQAGPSSRRPRG